MVLLSTFIESLVIRSQHKKGSSSYPLILHHALVGGDTTNMNMISIEDMIKENQSESIHLSESMSWRWFSNEIWMTFKLLSLMTIIISEPFQEGSDMRTQACFWTYLTFPSSVMNHFHPSHASKINYVRSSWYVKEYGLPCEWLWAQHAR